jgi:hypothetical protein
MRLRRRSAGLAPRACFASRPAGRLPLSQSCCQPLGLAYGHHCFDEARRDFDIDCIARTPQESHAARYPCSQRECAGCNWPPDSVCAVDPVRSSPEAVNRAGPASFASHAKHAPPDAPVSLLFARLPDPRGELSCACGVVQPAIFACVPSGRLSPCQTPERATIRLLRAFTVSGDWSGPIAAGVAQPASATVLRPLSVFPASL